LKLLKDEGCLLAVEGMFNFIITFDFEKILNPSLSGMYRKIAQKDLKMWYER
jgi:hypothetical protein